MASAELLRAVQGYEKYIQENGADIQAVDAMTTAADTALVVEHDRKYGLSLTTRCKTLLENMIFEYTDGGSVWDLEKYCYENRVSAELLEKYYAVLLMEAQNMVVDSAFRYLEIKRNPKEQFYMPKRRQFLKFGLTQALQNLLDDKTDILCISMPPGTGKTTAEKFFHALVMGWFPNDYSLFYSHSGDITRMYYDGVLQIVQDTSEYTWGRIFPNLKVTSTNAKLEQANVGKYKPFPSLQCTSVGANNAGKVRASKFLLVDDMIGGIEQAMNNRILDKLWDNYTVDARQRKTVASDGKFCKEIHIATRWSVRDVIGRIQQNYADDERVECIAIPDIDPVTGKSNFDYEFGGFTVHYFNDIERLMDDISYRCLYKQEPIEREGLLYHEEDLRRYLQLPTTEPDAVLGICDVKNKGTDYMFLPVFYQYGADYYLVDCVCDNDADFGVQEDKCAEIIMGHNVQQCEFEANNGGDRFASNIAKRIEDQNGRCNITTKFTETNKETKILVNADWIKKHVLFRDKEKYTEKDDYGKMMGLLLSYSTTGKNATDDVPDGLAMFSLYATKSESKVVVEAVRNPFSGGYYVA